MCNIVNSGIEIFFNDIAAQDPVEVQSYTQVKTACATSRFFKRSRSESTSDTEDLSSSDSESSEPDFGIEKLFKENKKNRSRIDLEVATCLSPEDYELDLDQRQKEILAKEKDLQPLGLNIMKCLENTDNLSPTSAHQKKFNNYKNVAEWVKGAIFKGLENSGADYLYNLEHIYDSDDNGGGHIHRPSHPVEVILENSDTKVVYGQYRQDPANSESKIKLSSFFPPRISNKLEFLKFMSQCVVVAKKRNKELLLSETDDIYVIRYVRIEKKTSTSAFPLVAVDSFDPQDQAQKSLEWGGVSVTINAIFFDDKEPMFETSECKFYDISSSFGENLQGIFIKLPK